MLFNLLYSYFINCNSVSFAESALYLISLANMPLSEALGLSNTTKLFNHFILFSTLSHRFCYWPFMLQGEWHQPWPEHFRAVLYNNSSFFIFVLICSLKDKWKSYCKVKWVQMTPTLSISSKKWRNVFGHSVATDPSCVKYYQKMASSKTNKARLRTILYYHSPILQPSQFIMLFLQGQVHCMDHCQQI